jgi:ADP-L-glycero-D-manno-heptose 6-epimerase
LSPFSGRILVTGGAGLIGSAVIWFLNRQGYENILVADKLDKSDKWKNLAALSFFDYCEAEALRQRLRHAPETLADVRCVFHLGACSDTEERDSAFLMDTNYLFTQELANWAVQNQVRMVYASSAATYGDGSRGFSDRGNLEALRPLNAYGYSKQIFDRFAHRQGWLEHLVGLKYFNVYGPNEQHKGNMRSLVHKALEQIQTTGRVGLFKSYHEEFADGEQRRDFLYVKEAAELTVKLAEGQAVGIFNVGSGKSSTWNELAAAVFDASGHLHQVDYIEMPESLRDRYQYDTQADLTKLNALGLEYQKFSLREGVYDTVRNYLLSGHHLGDEIL